jgi:hypothetical protein
MKVQSQIMELKAKVYDRDFYFCIQDTIQGVAGLGSIAIL